MASAGQPENSLQPMDEDPPPEAAVVEKKRGRPKGSTRSLKCRTCSKNGLPCGASCPNVDGGPSANAAASEGAASSRPATASGDHLQHDVQTPLHGGPVLVPPSLGADEATPADGPGMSAAHGSASTAGSAALTRRRPRPRNLDADAPERSNRFVSAYRAPRMLCVINNVSTT